MSRRRRPLIVGLLAATAATAFAASPALAGWGPVLQPAASDSASKAALSVNGRGAVGAAWLQQYGRTVTVRSTAIAPRPPRGGADAPAGARPRHRRPHDRARRARRADGRLGGAGLDERPAPRADHGASGLPDARRPLVPRADGLSRIGVRVRRAAARGGDRRDRGAGLQRRRPRGARHGRRVAHGGPPVRARRQCPDRPPRLPAGAVAVLRRHRSPVPRRHCPLRTVPQRSGGVLLTATERRRRIGAERTIAPAPAMDLRFVHTGLGRALAAWVGTGCSTTEDLSGPILATNVGGDAVGTPSIVSAPASRELTLSGAPAGSAELSFTQFGPTSPAGAALVARLAPDGTVTPPTALADGWAAVTADRAWPPAGDPGSPGRHRADRARGPAASGAAVAPAPLRGPTFFVTASAAMGALGGGAHGRSRAADHGMAPGGRRAGSVVASRAARDRARSARARRGWRAAASGRCARDATRPCATERHSWPGDLGVRVTQRDRVAGPRPRARSGRPGGPSQAAGAVASCGAEPGVEVRLARRPRGAPPRPARCRPPP